MNCTFFGHQDATSDIKGILKETILYLMETEGVKNFLVGNNGQFDFYVQSALREIKNEGADICFRIILSRLGESALAGDQSETVFPEGLENSIPKFAISKRNDWLIKNSSFVIVYVTHTFSNSYQWMQKASRKGLKIFHLADKKKKHLQ